MPRILLGLIVLCSWAFASTPGRVMFHVKSVNLAESTAVIEPMITPTYTVTWKFEGNAALQAVPAERQIWHCIPGVIEYEGHHWLKFDCWDEQGRDLGSFLGNKQTFTKEMK